MRIPKEIENCYSAKEYRQLKAKWDELQTREAQLRTKEQKLKHTKCRTGMMQELADELTYTARTMKNIGEDMVQARQNLEIDIQRHIASMQRQTTQATIEQLMAAV